MTDQTDLVVAELSVDEIIAELDAEYTGDLPERAIHAARRRRDEIIPRLIECIEKATSEVRAGGEPTGEGHFLAIMLLTEFGAVEALPAILDALSLPGEGPFDLFGDLITSTLPRTFAALVRDQDAIDAVIGNRSLNEYVRWSAVDSYVHLVRDERVTLNDAIQSLTRRLRSAIDNSDAAVASPLVVALGDFAAASALDDIRTAYDLLLVDPGVTRLSDVEEDIAGGEKTVQDTLSRCQPTGIADTIEELRGWAAYDPQEVAKQRAEEKYIREQRYLDDVILNERALRADRPPTRKAKPGPNEPCPCGSGKKFKRCCGRE